MQRRILIVDDHDDLASDLRAAFSQMQHRVTTLESRDDAVNRKDLGDYDVLIIDLDDVDEDCKPVTRNGSPEETKS